MENLERLGSRRARVGSRLLPSGSNQPYCINEPAPFPVSVFPSGAGKL
jgi:hypothetical protein